MNLSGIKLVLAHRNLRFLPPWEASFQAEKASLKVGLILDCFDDRITTSFQRFLKDCFPDDTETHIVYCSSKGTKENDGKKVVFKVSDISWAGRIVNEKVLSFIERDFDLLISFTDKGEALGNYLVKASRAVLKVGRQQEEQVVDLAVSASMEEVEVFTSELRKYIKIINKTI